MDHVMPWPPLLGRVPPRLWSALSWSAAAFFGLLLLVAQLLPVGGRGMVDREVVECAGLALVSALPIGLGRRWPLPMLGVLVVASSLSLVCRQPVWVLYLPVFDLLVCLLAAEPGLGSATERARYRVSGAAGLVVLAVELGEWRIANGQWGAGFRDVAVPITAATVLAWLIGASIRQRRRHAERLRAEVAEQAVAAERLRIARELHDMVAHSIGVIAIQAGAAGRIIESRPARAREALGAVEATSRETLAGLRRMLVALRQADGQAPEFAPVSGLADLERLAADTARAGVGVEVRRQGRPRPLPPEIELAAFRIVQESVANVVRHADSPHCQVSLAYEDEELAIEVVDHGRGDAARRPVPEGAGWGIAGMRERVALLNGRFSAGPGSTGGFRVMARLPL
ncbi:sensor histidine kinase [Kitasatospora sp. GAS204B]|uniref:sensor histidine kinase n=1 Tax=unclassified Kitasatospora TaxID=2633591 RepID=UPI002474F094|nr:sensor histidine kinase [Kitasatospora sp. GAS204B]MDH6119398.1 signal transduction histidine kinase [Kitasatospora sp. GAS204B]